MDFPFVRVDAFKRVNFPNLVVNPSMIKRTMLPNLKYIKGKFREEPKLTAIRDRGFVYEIPGGRVVAYKDMTDAAKEVYDSHETEQFLTILEGYAGKTVDRNKVALHSEDFPEGRVIFEGEFSSGFYGRFEDEYPVNGRGRHATFVIQGRFGKESALVGNDFSLDGLKMKQFHFELPVANIYYTGFVLETHPKIAEQKS